MSGGATRTPGALAGYPPGLPGYCVPLLPVPVYHILDNALTFVVRFLEMDYKQLTNRELALMLNYGAQVGKIESEMAIEAAKRIDPEALMETPEARKARHKKVDARYRKILAESSKIQAIKAYRAEFKVSLKDAKDYMDCLEASMPGQTHQGGPFQGGFGEDEVDFE